MLLTRLPLGSEEASFLVPSFDLHVLSTPPAFVLSQDQTLHDRLFVWLLFVALFLAQIHCSAFLPRTSALFVRCTVQFSKNHRSVSDLIIIPQPQALVKCFFEIFSKFFLVGAASSATGIILSHPPALCQLFFASFLKKFYQKVQGSRCEVQGVVRRTFSEELEVKSGGAPHKICIAARVFGNHHPALRATFFNEEGLQGEIMR